MATPPPPSVDAGAPANCGATQLADEEIWQRLRACGLDEETIKKRDKAALLAFVNRLQSQVDDCQHHLGLLILERNQWMSKCEQLKTSAESFEIAYKREQVAHSSDLAEATKREQSLRKFLGIEKECVANIEKALHDMRVESAEIKVAYESKIAEAHKLIEVAQLKFDEAESKMLVAESLQAESNRKQNAALRTMEDVENRENELRRRFESFKSEYDTKENEIHVQRLELRDSQKLLDEQQQRLFEEKSLLNRREALILERTKELKHVEKELEEVKANIEEEYKILRAKRSSFDQDMTDLSSRKEAIVMREALLDKREQEFLILQEKIACKEKEELQRIIAEHTRQLEVERCELESEIKQKRKYLDAEIHSRTKECEVREADVCDRENTLDEREQALKLELSLLAEKEDHLSNKASFLDNKEKDLCSTKCASEIELENLQKERECVLNLKLDLEKAKISLEQEKEEIFCLRLGERNELLILEMKLAEEILSFRAKKMALIAELDRLKAEREDLENKWELIDGKRLELEKEAHQLTEEKKAVAEYLEREQNSLKVQKESLYHKFKNDAETLDRQREKLMSEICNESLDLFSKIQQEREDFFRDINIQRKELEDGINKRREEIEMYLKDKEEIFEKEKAKEIQQINSQKEMIARDLEFVASEMQKLQNERKEIALSQKQMDMQWADIKNSIEALDSQREKLQKQREMLHADRKEIHDKIEHLKMFEAVNHEFENKSLSKMHSNKPKVATKGSLDNPISKDSVGTIEQITAANLRSAVELLSHNTSSALPPASGSNSWIKRCSSFIFRFSSEKDSASKSKKNYGAEVSHLFRDVGPLEIGAGHNNILGDGETVRAKILDGPHNVSNKKVKVGLTDNECVTPKLGESNATCNLSLSENAQIISKAESSRRSQKLNQLHENAGEKSNTLANRINSWFSARKRSNSMISHDNTDLEPRQGQLKRYRPNGDFDSGISSNCMVNAEMHGEDGLTTRNLNCDKDKKVEDSDKKVTHVFQNKLAGLNCEILRNRTSKKLRDASDDSDLEDTYSLDTGCMLKERKKVVDKVLSLSEEKSLDMSESATLLIADESKIKEKNECKKEVDDEDEEDDNGEELEIQMSTKQTLWNFLIT